MPELPEVQTIVNDLNDVLLNKKIVQLKVIDSKLALLKKSSTRERIINQKVINISRRAKNIIFLLANNYRLFRMRKRAALPRRELQSSIAAT